MSFFSVFLYKHTQDYTVSAIYFLFSSAPGLCLLVASWFCSCGYAKACVRNQSPQLEPYKPSLLTEIVPRILIGIAGFFFLLTNLLAEIYLDRTLRRELPLTRTTSSQLGWPWLGADGEKRWPWQPRIVLSAGAGLSGESTSSSSADGENMRKPFARPQQVDVHSSASSTHPLSPVASAGRDRRETTFAPPRGERQRRKNGSAVALRGEARDDLPGTRGERSRSTDQAEEEAGSSVAPRPAKLTNLNPN